MLTKKLNLTHKWLKLGARRKLQYWDQRLMVTKRARQMPSSINSCKLSLKVAQLVRRSLISSYLRKELSSMIKTGRNVFWSLSSLPRKHWNFYSPTIQNQKLMSFHIWIKSLSGIKTNLRACQMTIPSTRTTWLSKYFKRS